MGNYRSCKYVYKDQLHSTSKQAFAIPMYTNIQVSLPLFPSFLPSSLQHLHLYISEGEREREREVIIVKAKIREVKESEDKLPKVKPRSEKVE